MRRSLLAPFVALCAAAVADASVVSYSPCQSSLSSTGLGVMAAQALDELRSACGTDASCMSAQGLQNQDVCNFYGGGATAGAACCAYYKQLTGDASTAAQHYLDFCDSCTAEETPSERTQCVDFLASEGTTLSAFTLCSDPNACAGKAGAEKTACEVENLQKCVVSGKKGTAGVCSLVTGRGKELGCCSLSDKTDKMSQQIQGVCDTCAQKYGWYAPPTEKPNTPQVNGDGTTEAPAIQENAFDPNTTEAEGNTGGNLGTNTGGNTGGAANLGDDAGGEEGTTEAAGGKSNEDPDSDNKGVSGAEVVAVSAVALLVGSCAL